MIWVLVPLAAILSWAFVEASKNRAAGVDAIRMIESLAEQLDEATGERDRLKRRVENLETIVTNESYMLEKEAKAAGIGRIDPSLLDEDPASSEDEAARMADRLRAK